MAPKIKALDMARYRKLTPTQGARIYAELKENVTKAGILKRSYGFYALLTTATMGGFFFSLYQVIRHNDLVGITMWSLAVSFFIVQIGGLLHDGAHRAVFDSTKLNDLYGRICAGLVAMGYSNWRSVHNAHHARPNEEDGDPDLGVPYAFTKEQYKNATGFQKLIRDYQVWLYYPLGSLAMVLIRYSNFALYFSKFKKHKLEFLVYLSGFLAWYFLPIAFFPLGKTLLFLFITNNLTSLYLSNVFAPNHKGMPQIAKGLAFSFLEQQIITARNIYGHWMTDYIYLGLNYQIEHHLFPNCPRNKLRFVTPYVQAICKKYRIPFTQVSALESHRIILSELKNISASVSGIS